MLAFFFLVFALTAAQKPKNYVIMFADDFGYGDSSVFGHPTIRTPAIERLAREGIRFNRWYSANPICSPSRAALMTGRLSVRTGMSRCAPTGGDGVFEPTSIGGLPDNETTIAELLKKKAFATQMVGKWHLGINEVNSTDCAHCPLQHGFDHFLGVPYTNSGGCPEEDEPLHCFLYENNALIEQPSDYTNISFRLLNRALEFMTENKDGPFFLYYPFLHTHIELFASKMFLNTSQRGFFGDNAEEMDYCIGEVLDHLVSLGIDKDTLVFFTSDNGPWLQERLNGGSSGLLRGGKFQTWNGGIMEPSFAWWPGTIKAGRISMELTNSMDIIATIADFEEMTPPNPLDGKSIKSILLDETAKTPHEFMFHYCACHLMAVTYGAYKAHYATQDALVVFCMGDGVQTHDPPLLFNTLRDPSENYPLTEAMDSNYSHVLAAIKAAVKEHKANLNPAPSQQNRGENKDLQPCCNPPHCCCGPACHKVIE
ncbi:arylsulfatase-like [Oscarella lobularis]|uniref:arylsulfatase-like n=1 Tax=Oscarella lobularis TaxID=121494 RepID=UPI003313307B